MAKEIFSEQNIRLNIKLKDKYEAIRLAGQILVDNGYVKEEYIESMFQREKIVSVYIGNQIAIPHGVDGSQKYILNSGISLIQVPDGVSFGEGKIAKIIIGISGKNDEHLEILSNIAILLSEEENVEKLISATSVDEVLKMFKGVI